MILAHIFASNGRQEMGQNQPKHPNPATGQGFLPCLAKRFPINTSNGYLAPSRRELARSGRDVNHQSLTEGNDCAKNERRIFHGLHRSREALVENRLLRFPRQKRREPASSRTLNTHFKERSPRGAVGQHAPIFVVLYNGTYLSMDIFGVESRNARAF